MKNQFRLINSQFPLLATLLAFALRLWRIDAQSLRGDEAFDVLFAAQPLGDVLFQELYGQTYPPLYHLLDHFWLMLAGRPELSARFITFFAGVLIVPVAYRLTRALFDEPVARVTMLLVALHPFLIWHSQDGRMYMLMGTLAALSALWAVRLWRSAPRNRTSDWLLYVGVTTLSVMNHYFAYLAVFALNVAALYLSWRRCWALRFAAQWFGANALVGVLAAAWLVPALPHLAGHHEPWIVSVSPTDVLTRSLLAYSLGTTIEWATALPWLLLFVVLMVVGFFASRAHGSTRDGRAIAALNAFVPLAVMYLGSLWRPMYDEKFLLFVVPFYMLLIASGIVALREWRALARWQPVVLAAIAAGMIFTIGSAQLNPQYAKSPAWREAAQIVRAQVQTGDLIVYNFPDPALPYQMGDALPLVLLPAQAPGDAATAQPLEAASVEPALRRLSAQYDRIWFVPQNAPNWDPDAAVARWLSRFAERDFATSAGSLNVERYLTARTFAQHWTPFGARFADSIELVAYHATTAAHTIHLILYWQANATPTKDYTVFAHLLDDAGVLRAQQDNPPVSGTYPTTQWRDGIVVDRYDIIIPDDWPDGRYRFEIGMYDASGVRLRVGNDDKVIFGAVVK